MKIILGSQSPRRLEILRDIVPPGIAVEALPTGLDEKVIARPTSPSAITLKLAARKLEALKRLVIEPAVLVTADTVALYDDEIREKPESSEQARRWLRSYHRRPVRVITSVALLNNQTQEAHSFVDSASIWFWGFSGKAIDDIIADGTALGCAGAVMVEHPFFRSRITRILGDPCTVRGLPKVLTRAALRSLFPF